MILKIFEGYRVMKIEGLEMMIGGYYDC